MTSEDSSAELNFNNGSSWTMKPGTKIKIIVESTKNQTYFKVKLGVGGLLIRSQNMRNSSDIYYINTALGTVKILPAQAVPALLIYETGVGLIFSGMAELETNDKYQIKLKKPVTVILTPYKITYYDKIIQPSILEKNSPDQLKNDLTHMKAIEILLLNKLKSNKLD